MVCDKFSELTAGNPTLAKRKVLAGIVMTNDNDGDDIKVSIGRDGDQVLFDSVGVFRSNGESEL